MSIFNAYMALSGRINADVLRDEPLSRHTSYHIGGPAALFVTVHNLRALSRLFEVLHDEDVPWVLLGRGTNVLASDTGYSGCVICLGRGFSKLVVEEENNQIVAGAAVKLNALVQTAMASGLAGADFLAGIPGSVGGALRMNAGTRNEWIGSIVRSVVCLRPRAGLVRYGAEDIIWDYRSTSIPDDNIVLETTFELSSGVRERIAEDMQRRLAYRRQRQPVGLASCGSVFRNPDGASVGRLIEDCGLAGLREGGAQISEKHANFIVNTGRATAADVCTLISRAHDCVLEQTGYDLTCEVKLLGFGE